MTSHSKSLGGGKAAGGFGFSVAGDRKRKRLAEYPCVSRLRQRRLLLFLISHDFVQTHKAFVGETAVLMNVMHLQHLVSHGQWSDAVEYLSRFLPSDRPLGVHGRALLHFLRVHKAIDDIVAGARESLSVVAAVTMCSDRFVTSNPALTKLRAIFSSLIESKTPRDSVDLVSVRREASLVIHELVYRTPELRDYMRPCHGSTNPQNVLPLGFGHASFRPRRHVKKQGGQVPASVVAGIYLQKKKMLPSSPSSDHFHGFTREALVRAKEWLVDLVDKSVEAGKPRLRDPVRSACTQGAPGPQTTSCTVPRLGGKSRTRLLTDLVLLREAKEWLLYLTASNELMYTQRIVWKPGRMRVSSINFSIRVNQVLLLLDSRRLYLAPSQDLLKVHRSYHIQKSCQKQALVIFPSNKGGCYCPGVYSCFLDQYMQTKNVICSMQEPIL